LFNTAKVGLTLSWLPMQDEGEELDDPSSAALAKLEMEVFFGD
jgi:hypothetical protein